MWSKIIRQLQEANKELWLLLMMFSILAGLNYLVASDRMLLGFYILPSVYSAYFRGRRHAVLTALASVLLVVLVVYFNPSMLTEHGPVRIIAEKWWDVMVWGGTLLVIAYAMGTLYEKKEERVRELRVSNKDLRDAYKGVLILLRQMTAHDKYTHDHCFRVALYAATIAKYMDGFDEERIDTVRDASLLHDLGKIETSRELLYKAANFTASEYAQMQKHPDKGQEMAAPVGGPLRKIIPIILAHHDKYDGSGYRPFKGDEIPLEARIITVADVYDAVMSDRPYRKAMSPLEAKEIIRKGSGKDFDPKVVEAFQKAYQKGELEINPSALEELR